MRLSSLLLLALSWTLLACLACEDTDEMDRFTIEATLDQDTCGPGALDSAKSVNWAVSLSLSGDTLTWRDDSGGTPLSGLVEDGEFAMSETDSFMLGEARENAAGCLVRRVTRYQGTLEEADARIADVSGTMVFQYSEATDYDCDALVGAETGFKELPCKVSYDFVAEPQ